MTPRELIAERAVAWFQKRQAFLDAEVDAANHRHLLNECSDGEHDLAAAVREHLIACGQRSKG